MSDPSLILSPFPMHKVAAGLGKKSSGKTGFPLGVSLLHFRIWLVLIIHIVAAVNRIRSKGERCCKIECCTQWGRWCRSVGMVVWYFWVVGWLPVTYPFEGHRIIGSKWDKFINSYSATGRWQFISSLPILQDQERPGVRRFLADGDTAQDASQDWRRATFPTNLRVLHNHSRSFKMIRVHWALAWEEQQDPESAETPMETTTGDQEDLERQSAAKQSDLSEAIKGWPSFQWSTKSCI